MMLSCKDGDVNVSPAAEKSEMVGGQREAPWIIDALNRKGGAPGDRKSGERSVALRRNQY